MATVRFFLYLRIKLYKNSGGGGGDKLHTFVNSNWMKGSYPSPE